MDGIQSARQRSARGLNTAQMQGRGQKGWSGGQANDQQRPRNYDRCAAGDSPWRLRLTLYLILLWRRSTCESSIRPATPQRTRSRERISADARPPPVNSRRAVGRARQRPFWRAGSTSLWSRTVEDAKCLLPDLKFGIETVLSTPGPCRRAVAAKTLLRCTTMVTVPSD